MTQNAGVRSRTRGSGTWLAALVVVWLAGGCGGDAARVDIGLVLEPGDVPDHLTLLRSTDELALLLGRDGRVANLVLREFRYQAQVQPTWGSEEATWLTRQVYGELDDAFDFIFFAFDERSPRPETLYGRYLRAKLEVEGLAIGLSQEGRRYGSTGRLKGVVMLRTPDNLRRGPSLHELLHHWGQSLLRGRPFPGHWGAAGVGGQLGGWAPGTLTQLDDGSYTGASPDGQTFGFIANYGNRPPYAPLELYLMGLLPADSVSPVQVAVDPVIQDTVPARFRASGFQWFDLDTHIAEFGPRVPAYPDAPSDFRVLFVVVTRETPLPFDAWQRATRDVEGFGRAGASDPDDEYLNFWEATGGRGTLRLDGLFEAVSPD